MHNGSGEDVVCPVSDVHFAKFCCEEAPPTSSSCSACDGDYVGFTLWVADMNAAGWPNNKTWTQVPKHGPNLDKTAECCDGYAAVMPAPDADPNWLPDFSHIPEHKYRKECCVCDEVGAGDACANRGPATDFSCSCEHGWCQWGKSPLTLPGPWGAPGDCNCDDGYSSAMPKYTDWDGTVVPGADVVGSCGWGIDSIIVFTCCS